MYPYNIYSGLKVVPIDVVEGQGIYYRDTWALGAWVEVEEFGGSGDPGCPVSGFAGMLPWRRRTRSTNTNINKKN